MYDINLSDVRALIAVSNNQVADYLTHFVKDNGADNALVASTSAEASKQIFAHKTNLVIVDDEFHDDSGLELLRIVRMQDPPLDEAVVIMLLHKPDKEQVIGAMRAGAHEIIALPLTGQRFKKKIADVYNKPRPFIRRQDYKGPVRTSMH